MEKFDLYDINRIKTGETLERIGVVPRHRYRVVVHIIVFNSKGEMLIQQRVSTKRVHPNKWDFSVGGCVIAGETSWQGAERELSEEIGLKYDFSKTIPNFTINFETGFDDFYVIHCDKPAEEFVLQESEVKQVKWANKDEVLKLIETDEFVHYKKELVDLVFLCHKRPYGVWELG